MIWNMRRRKKKPKLKWYFNADLVPITIGNITFTAAFESAGNQFKGMEYIPTIDGNTIVQLSYMSKRAVSAWVRERGWVKGAYRTVKFEKEPTGELLRFLQKNATPR